VYLRKINALKIKREREREREKLQIEREREITEKSKLTEREMTNRKSESVCERQCRPFQMNRDFFTQPFV
jgi:hypothetical protein